MGKLGTSVLLVLMTGLWLTPEVRAQSSTKVIVAFSTANSTNLNPGFAGFNTAMLGTGVEYYDSNFQQMVSTLSPGRLRYPAGTRSDAFDWTNGLTLQSWVNEFTNVDYAFT